ncbi:PHD and RING finger domain-containing protein 1-like [Pungitius pungitius]|uniref:PHD and RING finger domain-containing protein 1-like n=1 Tax=Pungitius pungitius TaxID=134920 RepID=UPI002E100E2C
MYKSTVSDAVCGEDADKCSICLSPFEKQRVASLEKCQHVFCLECILQWSQTATTCPVDRISFDFIQRRRCPGGAVHEKIKVKANKREEDYDEDEEEEERNDTVICEECGRGDRTHQLLVCTRCDAGFHTDCLTPPLDGGPGGDWICARCAVTPQHADELTVEAEISDGELTDLLAEADGSASTSTRLRPSSLHRPSSSPDRRRSQRVPSSAGADPPPRARSSRHVPPYLLRPTEPAGTTAPAAAEGAPIRHSAAFKLKRRKRRKRAT